MNDARAIYDKVKKATVAIIMADQNNKGRPFRIIGSGFCVHPQGVVVTCEHVFKAFVDPEAYEKVVKEKAPGMSELKALRPVVLFHSNVTDIEILMMAVPVMNAITKTDFDLAALKLQPHAAFRQGFPVLETANYEDVHEMMEIGLCGFPLGSYLQDQIGTVTSSFTRGIVSSIIPAAGVSRDGLHGFQLNLTATNGNSGGPVFALETGQVFAVLSEGVVHPNGGVVQGLAKAEPIYPIFANDLMRRLLADEGRPPGF